MEIMRYKKNTLETKKKLIFQDLSPLVQTRYTKYQDDAWKIFLNNKDRPTHFQDRLTRAQNNIDFSIELLTYLAENNLLDEERKIRLRKIYIS